MPTKKEKFATGQEAAHKILESSRDKNVIKLDELKTKSLIFIESCFNTPENLQNLGCDGAIAFIGEMYDNHVPTWEWDLLKFLNSLLIKISNIDEQKYNIMVKFPKRNMIIQMTQ